MKKTSNLMELAFKSPYASKICADIGKILAKDNSGHDATTFAKRSKQL